VSGQVHFEVFARRTPAAPWTLQGACESRDRAVEQAEALLAESRACAIRVSKETLNPETGEFRSVVILTRGDGDGGPRRPQRDAPPEPPCVTPADLYTVHARERIGRLLEGWLARARVTPFEMLHRPDLAERLDASGVELQHAVQKVAVPEAQARNVSVHSQVRAYSSLADRALARLIADGRRRAFPDLHDEPPTEAVRRLQGQPDAAYLLGGGVAALLADARDWDAKAGRLLDLADEVEGPGRGLLLSVVEQPLAEIMASRTGLVGLLGAELDLGGSIAALTVLTAGSSLERLLAADPPLGRHFPPLTGAAARLRAWFDAGAFPTVRTALGRRILAELTGPRRLRPSTPSGEIELLRALAMALTAAAGDLFSEDDVRLAFVERSRRLVAADFIEAYLGQGRSATDEARALIWLAENVAGGVNKRAASRWLLACVGALRFETELRTGPDVIGTKLAALAELQRAMLRAGLDDVDGAAAARRIGEVGGLVEADAKLTAAVARASAPAIHRIITLLQLAAGGAPLGPAADRARTEALKLLRTPEVRDELAAAPETRSRLRSLLDAAQLAA
jgi:hypothetical protein